MDPSINQINTLVQRIEELSEELDIANDIIDILAEELESEELSLTEATDLVLEAEKKKWIQHALRKHKEGQLHKDLKVKKGEKISEKKLEKASHAKGKKGQRARLAMKLREYSKKKKELKEAADLSAEYQYLSGMLNQKGIEPQKAEAIKARLMQIKTQLSSGTVGNKYNTTTIEGQY